MRTGPEGSTVNGIDTYAFPMAIPEEVVIIDDFPVQPIPKNWSHIKDDLLREFGQAQPDGLGRRSACILVGHDRGYGGRSVIDVADSFPMALGKVPPETPLLGAISLARGGKAKEKNAMPSGSDFDRLEPLLVADAKFGIVQPDNWDMVRVLPAANIAPWYAPGDVEELRGETKLAAWKELIELTTLSPRECAFLAELRFAGQDAGISYNLLGSGVGYKGQSAALHPGLMGDLDIVAIGHQDKAAIAASFEAVATEFYGPLSREPKTVRGAGSGKLIDGSVYANTESGILIDFFAGNEIGDVLVRPEAMARGQAIKLS